jgi:three-Cys-motif partner protein
LSVQDKFSRYIFCDTSEPAISALRERVQRRFEDADVRYVVGHCNEKVDEIIAHIPPHSSSETVLSFCFVDPFDLGIHFRTIETLARRKLMDFLMLLALFMDANRNEKHYTRRDNPKVDKFLGDPDWRARWIEFRRHDNSFPRFLAREFEKRMLSLDYLKSKKGNTKEFRSNERNLPLYHLAFFSRHQRGYDFWEEGMRYTSEPPFDFAA